MNKERSIYTFSVKLSVFSTAFASGTLSVLLNEVISYFGVSDIKEGLMSSMISTGSLFALLCIILLSGGLKKQYIIIAMGYITATALILQGVVNSYYLFIILCFVMGLGNGAVDTTQSAFLADVNKENTSKHMGTLHGIFGIGSMLIPIILKKMLDVFSWKTIYVLVGLWCFVFITQFAAVTAKLGTSKNGAEKKQRKISIKEFWPFISKNGLLLVAISMFFGAAAQSGVIIWVIRYVSIYLNSATIGTLCLSFYWIACTISRILSPVLPFKPISLVTAGAFVSAITWFFAITINSPYMIMLACVVVGLTSGSCIPMSITQATSMARDNTTLSTSILMFFKTVAQALSPIIVSFIMGICNMQIGMYVTVLFFMINGLVGFCFVKRKHNII